MTQRGAVRAARYRSDPAALAFGRLDRSCAGSILFAPTALYAAGAKSDPLGRSTLSGATRHLTQLRGSGDRTRSDLFFLSAESEGDANFSMISGVRPRYSMCKKCTQQKTAPLLVQRGFCSNRYGGR